MINSIKTVNAEFYKVFTKAPILVLYKGANKPVRVTFFDRFNDTPAEVQAETYPVISIQSYTPKPSKDWKDNQSEYVDGFSDFNEETGLYDTGTIYGEPYLLDFRYDVSIAAKTIGEFDSLTDFMFKRFGPEGQILLLSVALPGGDFSGYPVWYKVEGTDIPRNDGVKECNYEFTFNCFVDIKDPKEVELINNLNITLNG